LSSSPDERPALVSIPTELERQDARRDIGILLFSVIFGWTAVDTYGVPLVVVLVLLSPVALYCLTGEPAADVGFVGDIAAGLRNRLGQRRAHEWLLAAAYYYRVAVYPVWRRNCEMRMVRTRGFLLDQLGMRTRFGYVRSLFRAK
jgi:hypothetical protein